MRVLFRNMSYSKICKAYEFEFYRIEEFSTLPKKPGLYSWHLICDKNQIEYYHSFFKNKFYETHIKGFLHESFVGDVMSKPRLLPFDKIDDEFIKIASALTSPPIYVGISKTNLYKRLNTHKRLLIQLISGGTAKIKKTLHEAEIDKDEESKFFAGRAATILNSINNELNEGNFFVKVIKLPSNFNLEYLKDTEYFLNRTFNPLLGRN